MSALTLDRDAARQETSRFTWRAVALDLLAHLRPVDGNTPTLLDQSDASDKVAAPT
jgi:hypothetical protein